MVILIGHFPKVPLGFEGVFPHPALGGFLSGALDDDVGIDLAAEPLVVLQALDPDDRQPGDDDSLVDAAPLVPRDPRLVQLELLDVGAGLGEDPQQELGRLVGIEGGGHDDEPPPGPGQIGPEENVLGLDVVRRLDSRVGLEVVHTTLAVVLHL